MDFFNHYLFYVAVFILQILSKQSISAQDEDAIIFPDDPRILAPKSPKYHQQFECGETEAKYSQAVAGNEPFPGYYPWVAAIGIPSKKNQTKLQWRCVGSLISLEFVLTTATCVFGTTGKMWARLGDHNLSNNEDGVTPVDIQVANIIVHPAYNATSTLNDIALLKLEVPATYSATIHPICLPSLQTKHTDYTNTPLVIAGWGSKSRGTPYISVLRHIIMSATSDETCIKFYGFRYKTLNLSDRILCADWISNDNVLCSGSLGAPLMSTNGKYTIVGIQSAGFVCGVSESPDVFTRVSFYGSWIQKVMQQ